MVYKFSDSFEATVTDEAVKYLSVTPMLFKVILELEGGIEAFVAEGTVVLVAVVSVFHHMEFETENRREMRGALTARYDLVWHVLDWPAVCFRVGG